MYSEVKDSGKRESFSTGAVRDTAEGKGRYDLLPAYALHRLARHFENGAVKYGDENWRKGIPLRRFMDSAIRHMLKFLEGHRDEDHAAAAAWNILGLIETQEQIRRGNLPESLNNLPDFATPNQLPAGDGATVEQRIADAPAGKTVIVPPPPALTFADVQGTYQNYSGRWLPEGMIAVKVRPSGVYRIFEDRCEAWPGVTPAAVKEYEDNGWWIPQVELTVYRHKNLALPTPYRLNGTTVEFFVKADGWQTSHIYSGEDGYRDFQMLIDRGDVTPVDLDACGTTDGVTPLPVDEEEKPSLPKRAIRLAKKAGRWVVEN